MPVAIAHRVEHVLGDIGEGVTKGIMVQVRAYAKNRPELPYNNANESICSSLGRLLGLPIPPYGFVFMPNEPNMLLFASLDFNRDTGKLPPLTNSIKLAKALPDIVTGLLLFDIWIGNPDRHPHNLCVDYSKTIPYLYVFDHGHALLGHEPTCGIQRLTRLEDRLASSGGSETAQHRHCMMDALDTAEHFNKWIDRVQQVPHFFIQDLCTQAVSLGITLDEARAAERFLLNRQAGFRELIKQNQKEFRGIKDWGLLNV